MLCLLRLHFSESYVHLKSNLQLLEEISERVDRLPVGGEIEGPAVIFQKDSTVLLPPHSRTTVPRDAQ